MTPVPPELTARPLNGADELGLFLRLTYVLDHELAGDLAAGRRRPEWMWVALRGERVVARLAWWTNERGGAPMFLDFFDLDDTLPEPERGETGLRLLETASAAVLPAGAPRPEYGRYVPPGWREDPAVREAVEARQRVMEASGARVLVERLRLEWRAGTPVPADTGRLRFRRVRDREDLLALMAPVMEGTLDAHGQQDLASGLTAREAAEKHYDEEFAGLRTPKEWWRIAELPDGTPVGFVIPARNNYHPMIAYIGVLPAHRGKGYVDDVLAEGTRVLAAEGVERIRAATDLGNVPMAKSFARLGYVNFERAIDMVWD
ncbi:GNAT family N-acetyltransferase [Streptomyces nitrosporeus]|uniref:GNAT family N-acetyltransferase n=1 Tax=Streptomyces nitrosporeus TaxID=28894 RepID=A0A5J6F768_9ACTN|nr:GNAT family N-acetyltransferase [Streptomyces nitrosporeus]QEU71494.1 GNAT family N-acetyltransferase [Streptomyces nitrosporeus]GGZ10921.1 N-acetyltransferase [Streptomyces nitrosporeus]